MLNPIHIRWLLLIAVPFALGVPLSLAVKQRNVAINTPLFIEELRTTNMSLSRAKQWRAKGVDVNGQEERGFTALSMALWEEPKVIHLLIDEGANVNAKNRQGDTALILAAENGLHKCVKLLLDRGAEVNTLNKWGQTALSKARISMLHPDRDASDRKASTSDYQQTIRFLKLAGGEEGLWGHRAR